MGVEGHHLAAVPLFARLPADALDERASSSLTRRYPQGQVLCSEGNAEDYLIVLEAGQLRVSRYTPAGGEAVLAVIEPPAAVGELALLDGAPRDATVTAQRAVTVRLVPRVVFRDLLRREPAAVEGLLRPLASLVRVGNARHADFVGLDVPGMLAKWLLQQARLGHTGPLGSGAVVVMDRSQGELAAELGTTRSTLNRVLHDFASLDPISIEGNRVTLHRPDRPGRYASERWRAVE